ncbi:dsDNA nuclease domain-containing protein [Paenibacillus sp. FSL F4-0122]|uniref:dsDNA nuclease domain-containing protein n=1 Tax=Paenibacillus sp. FSL F4-0122 TaxID=2921371 RepID=UPI0030F5E530
MAISSEGLTIDSNALKNKIKGQLKDNPDHSEIDLDYDRDIEILLKGYSTDLGGLVAIRGFVYQYYVSIYYMLQMLHSKDAWWDCVVFELMDDIALVGENQIRFVQVKTIKEEGQAKIFTLGDLSKREKGELNSWLDKLFLNYPKFNSKNLSGTTPLIGNDPIIEFEIATNNNFNKDLKNYSNNSDFLISDPTKLKELSPKFDVACKKTKVLLKDAVGKEVEWCLARFHLNHMDRFIVLKNQIIGIIKDLSEIDSLDVSERILKHIFYHVLHRTHSDSVHDVNKYVFSKEEIQTLIGTYKIAAMRDTHNYLQSHDIQSKFVQCINEIRIDLQRITSPVKFELIKTLTWIQEQFTAKSNQNVFVYARFLHLLFDMTSSDAERDLENSNELSALRKSIEMMTLCLTFYVEKDFLLSDAQLLTQQGKTSQTQTRTFTLFHAQEYEYFDIVCKKINDTAENCTVLNQMHEEFYCFILGSKKRSTLLRSKPHGVTSITDNYTESEQVTITEKPSLIKYYNHDFLEDVKDHFYNLQDQFSLIEDGAVETWHDFLNQNGLSQQRKVRNEN